MRDLTLIFGLSLSFLVVFSVPHSAALSEELVIVGTGSGVPLLKALAEAFADQNPGIVITIPGSIGSGGGIKAVGHDEYLLGRVARDIKDKEKEYGLDQVPIAKIPIVFLVNSSVTLSGITHDQACRIYDGSVRRWEEINGGNGKIRVIKREEGDSSLIVLLETLPGFKEISLTPRSKTTYTDQENIAECKTQENAIAFGSWADVKGQQGIHALELGGLHPSSPSYPHNGFLSLVYKRQNYKGTVKRFIEFIFSASAREVIVHAGGLPVK